MESLWLFFLVCLAVKPRCVDSFLPPQLTRHWPSSVVATKKQWSTILAMKGSGGEQEQAMEVIQSLGDFHQGSWDGKVTSFTVTPDVAAGIIQKKTRQYTVEVNLSITNAKDLAINELYSWDSDEKSKMTAPRSLSILDSSLDCDAVDSSYSLHSTNQPDYLLAMADLSGTDKEVHFSVEQCIAASDDSRVRLLVLYGEKQELIRVVVLDETRLLESSMGSSKALQGMSLSATDLLELQSDVDRLVDKISGQVQGVVPDSSSDGGSSSSASKNDISQSEQEDRLQRLQESLAGPSSASQQSSSSENDATPYTRHAMNLLELTSGVWLGDSIIRDYQTAEEVKDKSQGGKGFGSSSSKSVGQTNSKTPSFGSWVVGVQKVAREWLWDFEEQIRQNNDAGKCLGVEMEPALGKSMAGSVCENQSLTRRIPKDERIVYVDWNDGNGDNHVGFLLGSVSIQVKSRCSHVSFYCILNRLCHSIRTTIPLVLSRSLGLLPLEIRCRNRFTLNSVSTKPWQTKKRHRVRWIAAK